MSNETQNTIQRPPDLTIEQVQSLAGAFARLTELRSQTIQTPTAAAESKGLIEHIAQEMLTHASEWIGCWFVANLEYQQLINALIPVFNRVGANAEQQRARRAAAIAAAQQQATKTEDSAAGKIITLS